MELDEIRHAAENVALEVSTFVRSTMIRIVRADRPRPRHLNPRPTAAPRENIGAFVRLHPEDMLPEGRLGNPTATPPGDYSIEEAIPTFYQEIELDVDKIERFLPISISSSKTKIKPKESASITARPQDAFRPHRIVIGGNPDHWIVSDIKIGRRSQFNGDGDLPGSAFSSSAPSVPMDVVPTGGNLTIVVMYVGPDQGGEEFSAVAFGQSDPGGRIKMQALSWAYLPIESCKIAGDAEISTRPNDPFRPERIVICGDASRWIVEDILVGNRSQTANAGPIPGTAFAIPGCKLRTDTVQTAMDFKIRVRYIGPVEGGEPFVAYAVGPIASLS